MIYTGGLGRCHAWWCVRQTAILGVVTSTGYLPQMAMMNEADVLLMCTCGVSIWHFSCVHLRT